MYANPRSPGLGFASAAAVSAEPIGGLTEDQVMLLRLATQGGTPAAGSTVTSSGLSQYLTTTNLLWAAGIVALAVILKER